MMGGILGPALDQMARRQRIIDALLAEANTLCVKCKDDPQTINLTTPQKMDRFPQTIQPRVLLRIVWRGLPNNLIERRNDNV